MSTDDRTDRFAAVRDAADGEDPRDAGGRQRRAGAPEFDEKTVRLPSENQELDLSSRELEDVHVDEDARTRVAYRAELFATADIEDAIEDDPALSRSRSPAVETADLTAVARYPADYGEARPRLGNAARAAEDRVRDDRARDGRARDGRAPDDRARDGRARDDRARDDRARDDRARDGRSRRSLAYDDDRARSPIHRFEPEGGLPPFESREMDPPPREAADRSPSRRGADPRLDRERPRLGAAADPFKAPVIHEMQTRPGDDLEDLRPREQATRPASPRAIGASRAFAGLASIGDDQLLGEPDPPNIGAEPLHSGDLELMGQESVDGLELIEDHGPTDARRGDPGWRSRAEDSVVQIDDLEAFRLDEDPDDHRRAMHPDAPGMTTNSGEQVLLLTNAKRERAGLAGRGPSEAAASRDADRFAPPTQRGRGGRVQDRVAAQRGLGGPLDIDSLTPAFGGDVQELFDQTRSVDGSAGRGGAIAEKVPQEHESVVMERGVHTQRVEASKVVPDLEHVARGPAGPRRGDAPSDGEMSPAELNEVLAEMAVLVRYGHRVQVQARLEEIRRACPEDLLLLRRVSEFQVRHGLKDAAMDTLFALASALFERRNVEGMRQALEQVLVLDPGNARAEKMLQRLVGGPADRR